MEDKRKKLIFDIAIGIGFVVYICLTTAIFVSHKKIISLKKQQVTDNSNSQKTKRSNDAVSNNLGNIKQEDNQNKDTLFKLGVHYLSKTGSEKKAIGYFEKLLQINPNNKNKSNIKKWLITLKKRYKRNQLQLLTNLQNLTKFIKENPQHYSVGLKKKQIEIIKTQLERNNSK
ncbi:hypothetical protein [Candidatus Uabimicrobium sp. HlEnr_7]|uniref:hypothetical protein n=1 Tax=Candidatus Uabimicrobium helgolandensis TaxID=3095367 RepID=UPI0035579881